MFPEASPGGILAGLFSVLFLVGCQSGAVPKPVLAAENPPVAYVLSGFTGGAKGGWQKTYIPLPVDNVDSTEPKAPVLPESRFVLIPEYAQPGEPVTIAYNVSEANAAAGQITGHTTVQTTGQTAAKLQAVLVDGKGRRVAKAVFFSVSREEGEEELKAAILAVPSTAVPGNASIRVESPNGLITEIPFTINNRKFLSETIPLDEENTDLRTKEDPQKTAEAEQLWAILSHTGTDIYCNGMFVPPVTSTRRTSFYGDRRVYKYIDGSTDTTIHAGIDYGVPTGTDVRACAAGKVVFAGLRIVTGNSVILEHMPGVYSLYYHMDRIAVSKGTIVETGTLLGKSGSTGLATGPHLHWEIRVSGEYADPDMFLSHAILDKKDILNKISNGQ
ncbi:MAG: M23 family metallopeptidase [Treponema sp.]|nr:M23 family metallopeptidase [Treponema sp.]